MDKYRREQLARYYRWLRVYGYNDSHSGNASCRHREITAYFVTPSGACADTITAEHMIYAKLDQEPPSGASLDSELHRQVYLSNPEVGAVLHSHVPHLVAITMDGKDFIPTDFEGQYYFKKIPVVDLPYDQVLSEARKIVPELLKEHPIVVVRGHGAYARGKNLDQAYKWTCSAELSAKTAWLSRQYHG
jgi:L-fuculose-phosphate aldolase